MTYTLFTATLALARLLAEVADGTATGGTTATLLDTSRTEPDSYFTGGVIWFRSGLNINKSAAITGWTNSTGTFAFATQTAACAVGNLYSACAVDYSKDALINAINQAQRAIGAIPQQNTALTTVDQQLEYTLPAGVYNVLRVEIAINTTAPIHYTTHYNWSEAEGKLVFDPGCEPDGDGYTIRVTYAPTPTEYDDDTDTISDLIPLELLVKTAAAEALRWRLARTGGQDDAIRRQYEQAQLDLVQARAAHPIRPDIPQRRDQHFAGW